jgi:hypothetical protein
LSRKSFDDQISSLFGAKKNSQTFKENIQEISKLSQKYVVPIEDLG